MEVVSHNGLPVFLMCFVLKIHNYVCVEMCHGLCDLCICIVSYLQHSLVIQCTICISGSLCMRGVVVLGGQFHFKMQNSANNISPFHHRTILFVNELCYL